MNAERKPTSDRIGGEVASRQCCDRFSPRQSVVQPQRKCWYCRYADFHLDRAMALDTGICRFPKVQSK